MERLNFIKNNTDDTFKAISHELIELLKNNGITATITGREKTPFSIWRKIQNKKISLEQLTDIIGFRVIVSDIEDCYKTLGIFHSNFQQYLENLKIIFQLQKLIIANQFTLQ